MNSKSTWVWGIMAVGLFAFIFFFERHLHQTPDGPIKVLSGLHVLDINAVAITPAGRIAIRVERTNHSWQITEPVVYPAQAANIDALLNTLKNLTSYPPITPAELRQRSKADEEFGFVSPQATVILTRGGQPLQILLGNRTAPGDQVFLRVVGIEDIYIVDAGVLDLLPHTVDDWRDRALVDPSGMDYDRLTVTSGGNVFELRRDATNAPWRIIHPMAARADNEKVSALLKQLPALQANQFASDHASADLDGFGFQPPDLELNFSNGTNTVFDLQFGKSPTNDPTQVFARRDGRETVMVVSNVLLQTWRSTFDNYLRDRHLLSVGTPIGLLEVHAIDDFALVPETNGLWSVQPQNFHADSNYMAGLIVSLATMQATQFVKDVVTDLPKYGLAAPVQKWIIHGAGSPTNGPVVELDFGATEGDRVYVKRSDEDSVNAVSLGDLQWLPAASWQLRDRSVWNFNAADVTNIVIREGPRERQIVRTSAHTWSLAPGSQGMINDLAIDQLIPRFAGLNAAVWSARSPTNLADYGFKEGGRRMTFGLKTGEKYTVEFGGDAPSQFPYATVTLEGETWVFEFPWDLYQLVLVYFSIPNVIL